MDADQIEKLRTQFEAWALTQGMVIERYPPQHPSWPGQYMWTTPHRDWIVWQACARLVRADALEEAAKVPAKLCRCTCPAEPNIVRGRNKPHADYCPIGIELSIRALAAAEKEPSK